MQPFWIQLWDLLLIQLTNWRWSWRGTIISGTIAPILAIIAFQAISDNSPTTFAYILTGNLVFTLLMEGVGKVSGHIAFMRSNGSLDYFATLPIHASALIVATMIAFFTLSMPATLVTLLAGSVILQFPLQIHPLIVLVLPLISLSLCGVGALIGVATRTPEQANSLSLLMSLLLFGFGPVLIPLNRFPPFMETLSLLSPATYAASALRQVVLGQTDRIPLLVDILMLGGIAIALLWFINQRLNWRERV